MRGVVTEREKTQLRRLANVTDVIYAIVIWRIVTRLPVPDYEAIDSAGGFWEFLGEQQASFEMILIGVFLVIVYWIQSNALFGGLTRTNNRHAAGSIIQIFLLLLYMYANRVGVALEAAKPTLALQSITLALMGFAAWGNWRYAMRAGLMPEEEAESAASWKLRRTALAEPVTACLTLALVPLGSTVWTLGFLVAGPLIYKALARWGPGPAAQ